MRSGVCPTRSSTIAVPLLALLAVTLSAIVLAAQAGLSFCGNRVAVPMPAMASMPGMDMSMNVGTSAPANALMICPVVLALIVASAVLAGAALVMLWCDPHRRLARRAIVRALARQPLGRTAGGLALAGAGTLALMLAVDGSTVPSPGTCALLAALLVSASLTATVLSWCIAHVALAFGRRLLLAIAKAISALAPPHPPRGLRFAVTVGGHHDIPLLAAGRGLRAPPSFVH